MKLLRIITNRNRIHEVGKGNEKNEKLEKTRSWKFLSAKKSKKVRNEIGKNRFGDLELKLESTT